MPSDRPAFVALLTAVGETFGVTLSTPRIELYWRALADVDVTDVRRACDAWLRTGTRFPVPAQLRALAGEGTPEDRAASAYAALWAAAKTIDSYASVRMDDPALVFAFEATFRTWPAFCGLDLSPEMWAAKRKEFTAAYHAGLVRGGAPRVFAGVHEQTNAARGLEVAAPLGAITADHRIARHAERPTMTDGQPSPRALRLVAGAESA